MHLIKRDTDYALRALLHMAQKPHQRVSVTELSPVLRVPQPYLRRILQTLARHRVLRSCRGKGGGFILNRLPDKIPLVDIIKIFQGHFRLTPCLLRGKLCRNRPTCPVRRVILEIQASALRRLKETTIASLL
ncbi:MAG: RrF2 family transcriptional regulator [Kiritimatiellia bacterium]